jgi:hypothetical protein
MPAIYLQEVARRFWGSAMATDFSTWEGKALCSKKGAGTGLRPGKPDFMRCTLPMLIISKTFQRLEFTSRWPK